MNVVKTGECYFIDESDRLCLSESWMDETGLTWTTNRVIDEDVLN